MLTRSGLALLWLLHFLPVRALAFPARVLATLAVHTRLARTIHINLKACFPELGRQERMKLARSYLTRLIRSMLELGILWWAPRQRIRSLLRYKNLHYAQHHAQPVIFLTFHTVGLEFQGAVMGMTFRGVGFFTPYKNPLIDAQVQRSRARLGDIVMLERKKGLRPLLRALKDGRHLYFLPDMDFGARDSLFAPFFGIATATVPTLPWLARSAGAVVVPCACRQRAEGYEVEFFPPWNDFPGPDPTADVARMNAFIESQVRLEPDQYLWSHKRFRTRPEPHAPNFYSWPQSLD